jgi:hypothetical protein
MDEEIRVSLDEAKEVFLLLEELNAFFHSPSHYKDIDDVIAFVEGGTYDKISRAYYEIVWNWLPKSVQLQIENRPSPFD